MAAIALVKPLTCIGGHGFFLGVPALWAGQHRSLDHYGHGLTLVTVDGNPASVVAWVKASGATRLSS